MAGTSAGLQGSLLIVWSSTEAKKVKVYTNPHPMGNRKPRRWNRETLVPLLFIKGKALLPDIHVVCHLAYQLVLWLFSPSGVSSADFTPDARLLATLSALIPEIYIMGKAPPAQMAKHSDSTGHEEPDGAGFADASAENARAVSSVLYQGVAIWNWKDAGQVSP